jgi:hypothetical protein
MTGDRIVRSVSRISTAACFAMASAGAAALVTFPRRDAISVASVTGSFALAWLVMARQTSECEAPGLFDAMGLGALLVVGFGLARPSADGTTTMLSHAWDDPLGILALLVRRAAAFPSRERCQSIRCISRGWPRVSLSTFQLTRGDEHGQGTPECVHELVDLKGFANQSCRVETCPPWSSPAFRRRRW